MNPRNDVMQHSQSLNVISKGDREIVITRSFAAPRELVFAACTQVDLIPRWMVGPPGWSMTRCENDQRVGGEFHYGWRNDHGVEMAMSGVYREVEPPGRVVRTETFETGCLPQAGEQIATLLLTEIDAESTLMTVSVVYPSTEARDAALASGMKDGMEASYAHLDSVLGEMVSA
jgi:uncharacterized protein YndB with AHSA1/START domain